MLGLSIVVGVLVGALAVSATVAAWYGLFGLVGGGVRRCGECHHLFLTPLGHDGTCSAYPHRQHGHAHFHAHPHRMARSH